MTSPSRRDDDHSMFTFKTPYFFKVILQEAFGDGVLGIPRKFVTQYGDQLSSPVKLEVPSGAIWQVELRKRDGRVLLQNGWPQFAEHYSLEPGSFVVFRYEGNDHFHVLIFDKSATEIKYPYTTTEDDVSVSRKNTEKPDLHISLDDPKGLTGVGGISASRSLKEEVSRCSLRLTATERARAIEIANAFESTGNPVFMAFVRPSYVGDGYAMCISSDFAREFLTMHKGSLTLCDSAGNTWPAEYYINPKCKSLNAQINGGWQAFAEDNHLKVDDICVFELIKHPEIVIKVLIYPAVENASKACRPQASRKNKEKTELPLPLPRKKSRTYPPYKTRSGSMLENLSSHINIDDDPNSRKVMLENSKKNENSCSPTGKVDGVGVVSARRYVKRDVSSCSRKLLATGKAHSVRIADAVKSTKNPVFKKFMYPSAVGSKYTLGIPSYFAREFLTMDKCNVTLCNHAGKKWSVKYNTNPQPQAHSLNAYLYGGWRGFVEDNHLVVGDVCVFELIKQNPQILMEVIINPDVKSTSKTCKPLAHGRIANRAITGRLVSDAKTNCQRNPGPAIFTDATTIFEEAHVEEALPCFDERAVLLVDGLGRVVPQQPPPGP